MPTFIRYKCAKCRKSLGTDQPYFSIGVPFLICDSCETVNIIAENKTEWDLKTPYKKFSTSFDVWGLGIIIGAGAGLVCGLLLQEVLKVKSGLIFVPLIALGIFVSLPFFLKGLKKDIEASRLRMKDENYRSVLKHLGLLEKSQLPR